VARIVSRIQSAAMSVPTRTLRLTSVHKASARDRRIMANARTPRKRGASPPHA
jgi:hypothetical protein